MRTVHTMFCSICAHEARQNSEVYVIYDICYMVYVIYNEQIKNNNIVSTKSKAAISKSRFNVTFACLYMHICVCARVRACVIVCVHLCMHARAREWACARVRVCTYVLVRTCTCAWARTCACVLRASACVRACICVCACARARMSVRACACVYLCICVCTCACASCAWARTCVRVSCASACVRACLSVCDKSRNWRDYY